jgi:aromatic ring-opening dioxygenase LigB subunit
MLKFASICPHPPLLIPSIGQNNLPAVNSTIEAMDKLGSEISKLDIDTIAIISPHGPIQASSMTINSSENLRGNFLQFGDDTSVKFKNDIGLGLNIKKIADQKNIPTDMINNDILLDHGTMVPLYFLTKNNPKIKIVPMSFSYLDYQKHFEFGKIIYEATENINEKIALVASGDLSHRLVPTAPAGYSPQGKEFDKLLIELLESNSSAEILNMDPDLIEEAGECGLRSIIILLGALSSLEYKFEKLSYEGPFGVGYLVGRFEF